MLGLGEGEREPSRQDVALPFLVRSKLFLAKATTSKRDVSCKYFPSLGASFPRKDRNCKPSLAACVSPISPGAFVKGELLPTLAARTCFAFKFVSPYLLCKPNLDDTCRLSHQDVVLPFLVRSKLFLAKATTSRRDVSCKYCGGYATDFPRKGRNCNPSLATCVSPISPGASVKGELLPTLAARTCFAFKFVSPYLLCKPNLDDTCRLSHNI